MRIGRVPQASAHFEIWNELPFTCPLNTVITFSKTASDRGMVRIRTVLLVSVQQSQSSKIETLYCRLLIASFRTSRRKHGIRGNQSTATVPVLTRPPDQFAVSQLMDGNVRVYARLGRARGRLTRALIA